MTYKRHGYRDDRTQSVSAWFERQALELADDSASRFRQVGLRSGQSVVEIGCGPRGCLDVRADAAGPTGSVIGVERSEDAD
jgi:tRNA A58 N-methylase Trm61